MNSDLHKKLFSDYAPICGGNSEFELQRTLKEFSRVKFDKY